MKTRWTFLAFCLCTFGFLCAQTPLPPPAVSYGDAEVAAVLRLDENVTLFCDIADFPPVIGKNMPVQIKGLKPAPNAQDNLKLLVFLNEMFFSKDAKPQKIILRKIQRGDRFCFVADVEVDGKDLCDLLVEKKLAQEVIEVPSAPNVQPANPGTDGQTPTNQPAAPSGAYIAAKSSKVFHRADCSHVKRMDASKAITFTTRQDAEAAGRRPCKTCNP
ncbi:MAG: hypothetical protein L0Y36_02050 [Planctomycetales bacterium]|nr:hypothetical protein [Planctomycetales bacterium]